MKDPTKNEKRKTKFFVTQHFIRKKTGKVLNGDKYGVFTLDGRSILYSIRIFWGEKRISTKYLIITKMTTKPTFWLFDGSVVFVQISYGYPMDILWIFNFRCFNKKFFYWSVENIVSRSKNCVLNTYYWRGPPGRSPLAVLGPLQKFGSSCLHYIFYFNWFIIVLLFSRWSTGDNFLITLPFD